MCMDWKWFLQIREPTCICARGPPGAPGPLGPDPLCCRDRWEFMERGRRAGEVPLGSGVRDGCLWGAGSLQWFLGVPRVLDVGSPRLQPQTAEVGYRVAAFCFTPEQTFLRGRLVTGAFGKPVGRGW